MVGLMTVGVAWALFQSSEVVASNDFGTAACFDAQLASVQSGENVHAVNGTVTIPITPVDPTGGEEEPPPEPAEIPPIEQRGGCASCSVTGAEAGIAPILFGGLLLGFAFRRVTR